MVQCSHDYVMSYKYVIADCDTSLVLKAAPAVEEDIFSYRYIFSTVSIKGRKEVKTFIHLFSDELRKNFSQLIRGMVAVVELCGRCV